MFGEARRADTDRYSLAECLAEKYGYGNVEELKKDGKGRFSLLESGILDKPSAKLLLANVSMHAFPGAWPKILTIRAGYERRDLSHRGFYHTSAIW